MNTHSIKRGRALLCLSAFCGGLVFYAPIATFYRQARGIDIFQITTIESISLGVAMALEVPWGYVAERLGYKKTLCISFFILALSKVVFWKADTFFLFLIERLLLAFANSGISGVDTAYLSRLDNRQRTYGLYQACSMAGLVLVSVVFPFFSDAVGQSGLLTVFSSFLSFLCILFLPEMHMARVERKGIHVPVFSLRLFRFLTAWALLSTVNQVVTVFLVQLCYEKVSLDVSHFSYPFLALSFVAILGNGSSSFVFGRHTKEAAFFCFSLALLGCTLLAFANDLAMVLVAVLLLRLGYSLFAPFSTSVQVRNSIGYDEATSLSIFQLYFSLIEIAMTPLFGYLAKTNIRSALLLGSVLCLIALVLVSRPRSLVLAET